MEHRMVINARNQPDSLARIFNVIRYHGIQVEKATIEKICPEILSVVIVPAKNTNAGKWDRAIKSLNKIVVILEAR